MRLGKKTLNETRREQVAYRMAFELSLIGHSMKKKQLNRSMDVETRTWMMIVLGILTVRLHSDDNKSSNSRNKRVSIWYVRSLNVQCQLGLPCSLCHKVISTSCTQM